MNDSKIRIIGAMVMGVIHYCFFMIELLVSIPDTSWLIPKTIGTTVLFVVTQWEPTRWVVMKTYHKWGHEFNAKRKWTNALVLIPFAFLVEAGRIQLEDITNYWTSDSLHKWSIYLINFRVSLIFVFLQVVFYESFFAFYEKNKTQRQAEQLKRLNLQMQYDSLKVQIQPHFLFNTLNTLVGLIQLDPKRATRFTEELAFVYRYFLAANEKPSVPLTEEIDFTYAYYFLFKTRYPEGLTVEFPDQLKEVEQFSIPTLSLQLLVENAIKHNIVSIQRPLCIKIELSIDKRQLIVSNNLQRKKNSAGSGKGLAHLKKKFALLGLPDLTIQETATIFYAKIPLLPSFHMYKMNAHEYSHH